MNGAFYIGATGLSAEQRALEVIANNIANINTAGFKRAEVRFSQLVADGADTESSAAAPIASSGEGVRLDAGHAVFSQGDVKPTGVSTDLAIQGEGLIELLGPAGQTVLWRGGGLKLNADGFLAAGNGLPLKAMISVPRDAANLTISSEGDVSAIVEGQTESLGRIELVRPKDMDALTSMGEGLYGADAADLIASSAGEDGAGAFVQGALESSNVQLSDEMITLLLLQRAYAANAQVVQAGDQLMAIANGLKR